MIGRRRQGRIFAKKRPSDDSLLRGGVAATNQVLKLGYEATLLALSRQDQSLNNLRNRATGLLSAITIATTVGASVGIVNYDPTKGAIIPEWTARLALALALLVGILIILILWPTRGWHHHPSPLTYLKFREESENEFLKQAITGLGNGISGNARILNRRYRYFQAATIIVLADLVAVGATALLIGR